MVVVEAMVSAALTLLMLGSMQFIMRTLGMVVDVPGTDGVVSFSEDDARRVESERLGEAVKSKESGTWRYVNAL